MSDNIVIAETCNDCTECCKNIDQNILKIEQLLDELKSFSMMVAEEVNAQHEKLVKMQEEMTKAMVKIQEKDREIKRFKK